MWEYVRKGFIFSLRLLRKPTPVITMDSEFPIFLMLMIFFMISFDIVLLLLFFLDQSWPFHWREFWFMFVHELFNTYICQQHLSFLYVTNRFWEGNKYFLKQLKHFFTKHCCFIFIINLEWFKTTLNEVKCKKELF